jgi:hypothetical protein
MPGLLKSFDTARPDNPRAKLMLSAGYKYNLTVVEAKIEFKIKRV